MIIYSFYTGETDAAQHFSSQQMAEEAAQEVMAYSDLDSIDIERNEVVPLSRENLIDILNSGGGRWARSTKIVKTIHRPKESETE